ncbi:MAG: type III-B CRISPR module RAMP protein Cmr6 [Thermoprotei archaeon]|nr:MAG: type III-B CRISPR module RAMP protein Cmr6 [Thermoprotei archaeon]
MKELNVFSCIQRAAVFYNMAELYDIKKSLSDIARELRRRRYQKPESQKIKEMREKIKRVRRASKELQKFRSYFPEFGLSHKLDDFLSNLQRSAYDTEKEVRNLVHKARILDKRHALELAIKILQSNAEQVTQRCGKLLDEVERAYKCMGYRVARFNAKLLERGVFGASQHLGKKLFETGLEFDPYLNTPIIPASSIKGALRAAYEYVKEESWPSADDVFGRGGEQGQVGSLIFTDAYPVKPGLQGMILYPDVLTPHYSRGGEEILRECGWEPTPLPYLSIAPQTTFGFIVASRRNKLSEENFSRVVKTALSLGLGGKSCVGYGRLELEVDQIVFKR